MYARHPPGPASGAVALGLYCILRRLSLGELYFPCEALTFRRGDEVTLVCWCWGVAFTVGRPGHLLRLQPADKNLVPRDFYTSTLIESRRTQTIIPYQHHTAMFMPSVPKRPADVYTVRFAEVEAQTSLSMSLRKLVTAAGGTFLINLIDGPGFV
jgi:hypothetical protein